MILFADTFHCFFFCASLPLFTNVFLPILLIMLSIVSARHEKQDEEWREERKGNKQRLFVNYVPLALLKSLRRENRRNLIYFHSSCFFFTESWNYKSRHIHAIPRVSASLQSWGEFFCVLIKLFLEIFHKAQFIHFF